eukprot:scaffold3281_cov286-Prasinococcus_capsulatus_cf.AAC.16
MWAAPGTHFSPDLARRLSLRAHQAVALHVGGDAILRHLLRVGHLHAPGRKPVCSISRRLWPFTVRALRWHVR